MLKSFVRFSAGCALLGITFATCSYGVWILASFVGH